MKIKILKSLKEIKFDVQAKNSGKTLLLANLLAMEEEYSVPVIVDMRAFIIYAKIDMLVSALRYVRKLERKGLLAVDRRWANVELEHEYVANRVKTLMWSGELRDATL